MKVHHWWFLFNTVLYVVTSDTSASRANMVHLVQFISCANWNWLCSPSPYIKAEDRRDVILKYWSENVKPGTVVSKLKTNGTLLKYYLVDVLILFIAVLPFRMFSIVTPIMLFPNHLVLYTQNNGDVLSVLFKVISHHINQLRVESKCIEVYEGFRTSV